MNSPRFLRASFRTGITLKGLDGLLEAVGGVLLWFFKPEALGSTLQAIFQHELLRDPHDFLAQHLLHTSERIAQSDALFPSIFLVSHGLVKTALSVLLWMNRMWAYPVAIAVFAAFAIFGIFRYMHTHATLLIVIAAFDLLVVWLVWEEWGAERKQRREPKA
jgi:uncharacterized membrane protein